MTPVAVAVRCSHWHEWSDRRGWVFPHALFVIDYMRGETRFQREAFDVLKAALVRHFTATGRAMAWMSNEGSKDGKVD